MSEITHSELVQLTHHDTFHLSKNSFYVIIRDLFKSRAEFEAIRSDTLKNADVFNVEQNSYCAVSYANDDINLYVYINGELVEEYSTKEDIFVLSTDKNLTNETKGAYVYGDNINPHYLPIDAYCIAIYDLNFKFNYVAREYVSTLFDTEYKKNDYIFDVPVGIIRNNSCLDILDNDKYISSSYVKCAQAIKDTEQTIRKEVYLNTYTGAIKEESDKIQTNAILDMIKKYSTTFFTNQIAMELFTNIGSDGNRSILILGKPGSGKTLAVIKLYMYIASMIQIQKIRQNFLRLVLVSYSPNVFVNQMSNTVDIGFIPLNVQLNEPTPDEKRTSQKYIQYSSIGYKQLSSRILTVHKEMEYDNYIHQNNKRDPMVVLNEAEEKGYVTINYAAIHEYDNSLLVLDESQYLQSGDPNRQGYAVAAVVRYGLNVSIVLVTATPFGSKKRELAFIQYLICKDPLPYEECFKNGDLIDDYDVKIIPRFKDIVLYSGELDKQYAPETVYAGEKLYVTHGNERHYLDPKRNYVMLDMPPDMEEHHNKVNHMQADALLLTIKINDELTVYNRETMKEAYTKYPEILKRLGFNVSISKIQGIGEVIRLSGPALRKGEIKKYCPKMEYVLNVLFDEGELWNEGKIIVVVGDVILPGAIFIQDVLIENGLVAKGFLPDDKAICFACRKPKSKHVNSNVKMTEDEKKTQAILETMDRNEVLEYLRKHPKKCTRWFIPIYIDVIHSYLPDKPRIILSYNDPINKNGIEIEVLIGTYVVGVSQTFNNTNQFMILPVPYSMSLQEQLEGRPKRAYSLQDLKVKKVKIHLTVMAYKDRKLNSRDQASYFEKYYDHIEILKIMKLLYELCMDRELYKSTQTKEFKDSLPNKKVVSSSYYANNFANIYAMEISRLIKHLFTTYDVLHKDTIVELVQKRHIMITKTNTSVFTRQDVLTGLYLLISSVKQTDAKYLDNPIGVTILYQTQVNVVIKPTGIIGSIQHIKEGIYMFVPHTQSGFAFRNITFDYKRNMKVFAELNLKGFKEMELKNFNISTVEHLLEDYSDHKKINKISSISKEHQRIIIKLAIEHWTTINSTYKHYIQNFIETGEVILYKHLPSIRISGVHKEHPIAYRYGDIVYYYSPLDTEEIKDTNEDDANTIGFNKIKFKLKKDVQKDNIQLEKKRGVWKQESKNPFNEKFNSVGVAIYYNDNKNVTIYTVPSDKKKTGDARYKTSGVQCDTIKSSDLTKILEEFYKLKNIKTSEQSTTLERKCENIEKIALVLQKEQWKEFLQYEKKMLSEGNTIKDVISSFTFLIYIRLFDTFKPLR